jgi:hypothetical protein
VRTSIRRTLANEYLETVEPLRRRVGIRRIESCGDTAVDQTYIPFCDAVAWFFKRTRSPATIETPSMVEPGAAMVMFEIDAALTGSLVRLSSWSAVPFSVLWSGMTLPSRSQTLNSPRFKRPCERRMNSKPFLVRSSTNMLCAEHSLTILSSLISHSHS